jgi:hypothetical protein
VLVRRRTPRSSWPGPEVPRRQSPALVLEQLLPLKAEVVEPEQPLPLEAEVAQPELLPLLQAAVAPPEQPLPLEAKVGAPVQLLPLEVERGQPWPLEGEQRHLLRGSGSASLREPETPALPSEAAAEGFSPVWPRGRRGPAAPVVSS